MLTRHPDEKWDHVLSCQDYNVLGERCPFSISHGNKCSFFGRSKPTPFPESGICDKHPQMAKPNKATLVVQDEVYREFGIDGRHHEYLLWSEAYDHYTLPPKERHDLEVVLLYQHACVKSQGYVSKREYNKIAKPQGKHLRPKEPKSFRQRALGTDWYHISHVKPEYVVLLPEPAIDTFPNEDGTEETYYDWQTGVLSRSPSFRQELEACGLDAFGEDLTDLMKEYEGRKILIKWSWWASQDYDGEWDSGVDYLELVRVL